MNNLSTWPRMQCSAVQCRTGIFRTATDDSGPVSVAARYDDKKRYEVPS